MSNVFLKTSNQEFLRSVRYFLQYCMQFCERIERRHTQALPPKKSVGVNILVKLIRNLAVTSISR